MPSNSTREDLDRFCAGTSPSQNGLEERLDMVVAQLASIAYELHELNEKEKWMHGFTD